jgi:hypothetical protein
MASLNSISRSEHAAVADQLPLDADPQLLLFVIQLALNGNASRAARSIGWSASNGRMLKAIPENQMLQLVFEAKPKYPVPVAPVTRATVGWGSLRRWWTKDKRPQGFATLQRGAVLSSTSGDRKR